MVNRLSVLTFLCFGFLINRTYSQVEERERPQEWKSLIEGGKFIDMFQPIPPIGKLTEDTWGTATVKPRYIDNGIEDEEWSYWGGNILKGEDGKYHLFVCRWREDSPKGHHEWPNSIVVHAVADNSMGPFKVIQEIGKGHNPEIFKSATGDYVIFVIDGYYKSKSLNGPWEYGKFDFDLRDRAIVDDLSNLTFAQREDGSYMMVCRGGGVWFSKDGLSTFYQVTDKRVYPPVDGRFEDPVIWKDDVQYHLIVNDWLGRIAFYQRSKDGVHWKTDPGEAYMPGITVYEDGTEEDWFKYERIKIFQDELGRAVQANFAVIDTLKNEDKPNDRHSSKNIGIPLNVGLQLQILNQEPITSATDKIRVIIKAEQGFNPKIDLDLGTLRFGASEEVNFGRGARVLSSKLIGDDLEVTFKGDGVGFAEDNFAGKLLGKNKKGDLVFGFSKLPWVDYAPVLLSSRKPVINRSKGEIGLKVENFGMSKSEKSTIKLELFENGILVSEYSLVLDPLNPFESKSFEVSLIDSIKETKEYSYSVSIYTNENLIENFKGDL